MNKAQRKAAHQERAARRKSRSLQQSLKPEQKQAYADAFFDNAGAPPEAEKHIYIGDKPEDTFGFWIMEPGMDTQPFVDALRRDFGMDDESDGEDH